MGKELERTTSAVVSSSAHVRSERPFGIQNTTRLCE